MDFPHKKIKEITTARGFDLITGQILQELCKKFIKRITFIFNAILQTNYFQNNWKVTQIIMIPKQGRN